MKGRKKKHNSPFFGQYVRERKREERDSNFSLRSTEIEWFGIRRAKNESSSTRRGLRMGTKKEGFH